MKSHLLPHTSNQGVLATPAGAVREACRLSRCHTLMSLPDQGGDLETSCSHQQVVDQTLPASSWAINGTVEMLLSVHRHSQQAFPVLHLPKISIGFAAEYALAALLAIVFVYTLTISHSYSAPFDSTVTHRKHWWKARLDAPGWLEQHEHYVTEASAAFASQVGPDCCSLHWL